MGASKWFFSMSGVILLVGALAIGGKGLKFGIDFESGTRIVAGLREAGRRGRGARRCMAARRLRRRQDPEGRQPRTSGDNVFQISTPTLGPSRSARSRSALDERVRRRQQLLQRVDRPDVRRDGGQQRDHRDHRLAAGDLDLHRAAVRVEVRRARADRADARPADHRGRVLAHRPGGDDVDGRGAAHDLGLLALRHASSCSTACARTCRACRARPSRQIVNRSMSEVLVRSLATAFCALILVLALLLFGGETLSDFAFALLVGIAVRRVLVDLHRVARAHALEGARARLRPARRARSARVRRHRARLRRGHGRRRAGGGRAGRAQARGAARRLDDARASPEEISRRSSTRWCRDIAGADGARAGRRPRPTAASRTSSTGGAPTAPSPRAKDKPKRPRNRRHGRNR